MIILPSDVEQYWTSIVQENPSFLDNLFIRVVFPQPTEPKRIILLELFFISSKVLFTKYSSVIIIWKN